MLEKGDILDAFMAITTEIQVEGIILSLEGVCFSIVIPKVFLLVLETLVTIRAEVK